MSTGWMSLNPIHCLECNLEVPPQRLGLDPVLADAVATWLRTYGAIDTLELESGPYEAWARAELLDPDSPPNRGGVALARQLNALVRTYFWFWQPQGEEDWQPPTACPVCGGLLVAHDSGLFPQLLCDNDNIVVVGG
jgi:predicted  nucleic acid-binding Zn ribbon protein